jgi:hypothetical protein
MWNVVDAKRIGVIHSGVNPIERREKTLLSRPPE